MVGCVCGGAGGPTLPELQRQLQPERAGPRCLLFPQRAAAPQAYQRGVLLNTFNTVSGKASCSTTAVSALVTGWCVLED